MCRHWCEHRKAPHRSPRRAQVDRRVAKLGSIRYGSPRPTHYSLAACWLTIAQSCIITANLVLQSTVERLFVPPSPSTGERGLYADISRGLFLVRGENVLLLGEIDLDKDDDPPAGYDKAELQVVESLLKARKAEDKAKEKSRLKKLASLGFEGEHSGEIIF